LNAPIFHNDSTFNIAKRKKFVMIFGAWTSTIDDNRANTHKGGGRRHLMCHDGTSGYNHAPTKDQVFVGCVAIFNAPFFTH